MKLTLIRHAEAIDKGEDILDEYRFLTTKGRTFFRKTVWTMKKRGTSPTVIVTSPLVRAVQTAEILAEALSFDGSVLVREELGKMKFGVVELQRLAAEFSDAKELVLVGHDPDFSSLVGTLLQTDAVSMKKGSAIRFKADPVDVATTVEFKWMIVGKKLIERLDEVEI